MRRIHVWLVSALCAGCVHDDRSAGSDRSSLAADGGEHSNDPAPEPERDPPARAGQSGSSAPARDAGSAPEPRQPANGAGASAGRKSPPPEAPLARPNEGEADDDAGAASEPPEPRAPPRSTEPVAPDQRVIPDETADADALRALADFHALPHLGEGRYRQHGSSDRRQPSDGLEDYLPLFGFGNRDLNNFVCRSLDADTFRIPLIPYTFDQGFCTEPYVRGVVLSRYEGSGRLVRMWMTVASLAVEGTLTNEILRVYVDDNPRPLIQAKLAEVMSGEAGEIFAPPFGAGSRAFVAWYYPVVFSQKLIIALDRLTSEYYHQTDVVLDPAPRPRVAPSRRLPERERAVAQLTAARPVAPDATALETRHVTLARGASATVQLEGPATIQEVRLRVPQVAFARSSNVQLQVRWDDRAEPAIDLPLRELFASGRHIPARSNLVLAATTRAGAHELSLRLPMPFARRAEWTFTQHGLTSAEFDIEWIGVRRVPSTAFGQLHVQRVETTLPTTRLEQSIARVSGRGHYVGLCADLAGESEDSLGALSAGPLNILEGDFRATADGKLVIDGTGTEDYPDNAFYFLDSPSATPFSQNWGLVDDELQSPAGQVSFCRWQILGNQIHFQSNFSLTHEIAVQDPSIVRLHRTVAYLYLEP